MAKGSVLLAASGLGAAGRFPDLTISRVAVHTAKGKRLTPVAPNAYAKYRGYEVNEPVVRIQTKQGLEGLGRYQTKPEILQKLVGLDPFAMFRWEGDVIADAAFQGQGCAISKASASMMTQAVKGKTVAEARALFEKFHEVVTGSVGAKALPSKLDVFRGVSAFPIRVKCATLSWHAMRAALDATDIPT